MSYFVGRKVDNYECVLTTSIENLTHLLLKDSYAIPRIEDILDNLSGYKYFTVMDMKSGYYQVEILENHKPRTAFTVGHIGFYCDTIWCLTKHIM